VLSVGAPQLVSPVTSSAPQPIAGIASTAPTASACASPQLQQGLAALALTDLTYEGASGHHTIAPLGSAGAGYVLGVGLLSTVVSGQCIPRLQLQAAVFGTVGLATGTATPTAALNLTPAAIVGFRLVGTWLVEVGVGFDALNAGGKTSGFLTSYSSLDNLHLYAGMICEIPSLTSSTSAN
jgi:hypothetical protein